MSRSALWRRLHKEELNNLTSSPNTIRVTKSRRIRWAGHVASMGEIRFTCRVLVRKSGGGKHHLEDRRVDGRMILKRFFKNWDGGGHGLD